MIKLDAYNKLMRQLIIQVLGAFLGVALCLHLQSDAFSELTVKQGGDPNGNIPVSFAMLGCSLVMLVCAVSTYRSSRNYVRELTEVKSADKREDYFSEEDFS